MSAPADRAILKEWVSRVGKAELSKLRIVQYPDPVLKRVSQAVSEFGPEVESLAQRMLELMCAEKGVGLAAPQVGVLRRLFVCNPTGEPKDDLICVNPRLAELSGMAELDEGCLSLPGVTVKMRRATQVVLRAFDCRGNPFEILGSDLRARIWQHETDHLDGRLIIDRMSTEDELANRKAIKQLQADFRSASKRQSRSS